MNAGAFYVSANSYLNLSSSIIVSTFSPIGSIFYFDENYKWASIIEKSSFYSNDGIAFLIDIFETHVLITDSLFKSNKNNLFEIFDSILEITNSLIEENICPHKLEGCIIKAFSNSIVYIMNGRFSNIVNEREEGNIYISNSSLYISFSEIINITNFKNKGNCISSYNGKFYLLSSNFQNYFGNCVFSIDSNITIENLTFNNDLAIKDYGLRTLGAFYCINCMNINVINSKIFNNIFGKFGSAMFISSNIRIKYSSVNIIRTIFFNNVAFESGSLYINNQNGFIILCTFENNSAMRGAGIFILNSGYFFYSIQTIIVLSRPNKISSSN